MRDPEQLEIDGVVLKRIISAEQIENKVKSLAQNIEKDFKERKNPLFICILKGSFIFASDLLRAYNGLCEIEFVRLSSYEGTNSTGKVKTLLGMDYDKLREREVVIVEDIIDSGLTMQNILKEFGKYSPKSIDIATLFVKPSKLCCELNIKYSCFNIPDDFIVGYGLDCDEKYRNLAAIYVKE